MLPSTRKCLQRLACPCQNCYVHQWVHWSPENACAAAFRMGQQGSSSPSTFLISGDQTAGTKLGLRWPGGSGQCGWLLWTGRLMPRTPGALWPASDAQWAQESTETRGDQHPGHLGGWALQCTRPVSYDWATGAEVLTQHGVWKCSTYTQMHMRETEWPA